MGNVIDGDSARRVVCSECGELPDALTTGPWANLQVGDFCPYSFASDTDCVGTITHVGPREAIDGRQKGGDRDDR